MHLKEVNYTIREAKKKLSDVELKGIHIIGIESILNELCERLDNHNRNITSLYNCLEQIVHIYRNMEKVIYGIRSIQTFNIGLPTPSPENLPYDDYIDFRIENAVDENTKKIYEKYRDKLYIKDDEWNEGSIS